MNRSFKLRLNVMEDRMSPASALMSVEVAPPPPDTAGALVFETHDANAEGAGHTVIVCDELIVVGERPTKK